METVTSGVPASASMWLATSRRMRSPSVSAAARDNVRHDDHEFLAAEAEHGVLDADRAHDNAGDAQQHDVAGGMAEAVVEALEVVDVENEQAQRPAGQAPPLRRDFGPRVRAGRGRARR